MSAFKEVFPITRSTNPDGGELKLVHGDLIEHIKDFKTNNHPDEIMAVIHGINSIGDCSGGFAKAIDDLEEVNHEIQTSIEALGKLPLGYTSHSTRCIEPGGSPKLKIYNVVTQINPGPDASIYGVCKALNRSTSVIRFLERTEYSATPHMTLLGAGIGGLHALDVIEAMKSWYELENIKSDVYVWCFEKEFQIVKKEFQNIKEFQTKQDK